MITKTLSGLGSGTQMTLKYLPRVLPKNECTRCEISRLYHRLISCYGVFWKKGVRL